MGVHTGRIQTMPTCYRECGSMCAALVPAYTWKTHLPRKAVDGHALPRCI